MGGACIWPMWRPVFRRREREAGSVNGTLEPVVSMQREKSKRRPREGESTDARHRGGMTRSSDEGCVMRLERRGRVIESLGNGSTVSAGGTYG